MSYCSRSVSRRGFLATTAAVTSLSAAVSRPGIAQDDVNDVAQAPFRFCLNMSTIRGQELSLVEDIEVAAKAGYDSIEPWMRKVDQYAKDGGSLADLGKRIQDLGLTVESAIWFAKWIVDDEAERKKGLEHAKRDMDTLRQIGGLRLAAPPVGATKQAGLDLFKAAARYRTLLELGDEMGVVPQVEVWGFSKNLSRLGESMFVAIECGHSKACLLPDVYHIFRGGSDFAGLTQISRQSIQVFHVNDYPASPARGEMNDSYRVYPGDGVAPLKMIYQILMANRCQPVLSLELFNRDYWKQDALEVARTGLMKTKESVARAIG
jgi:2-keto-myo-inositol isomerase